MDPDETSGAKMSSSSDRPSSDGSSGFQCADLLPMAALAVTCLALVVWSRRRRDVSTCNLPPGNSWWPVIGETMAFVADGKRFMRERLSKYGPVFRTSILGQDVVVVSGAEHIRPVLVGEDRSVVVSQLSSVRSLIGAGSLVGLAGCRHDQLHRLVTRTFNADALRRMTPAVHELVRQYVARWRAGGGIANGVLEVKRLAFAFGTNVLLGLDFCEREVNAAMQLFETFSRAFFSFPVDLPGFAYHKGMQARRKIIAMISKQLADLSERGPGNKPLCLMYDILQHQRSLDADADADGTIADGVDVLNLALELVFGGHETTASALCSLLVHLGHQPALCERIKRHLDAAGPPADGLMTYDDVVAVPYVRHVVNEVLRLSPPVAGAFRKTIKPMRIAGYDIPEGWMILYSIPSTHEMSPLFAERRGDVWPERWQTASDVGRAGADEADDPDAAELGEKLRCSGRFHYVPFGVGRRSCVGKEFALLCLRVAVVEIVRTGRIELVNGFPEMSTCPFVYPKDGLPLRFEKSADRC